MGEQLHCAIRSLAKTGVFIWISHPFEQARLAADRIGSTDIPAESRQIVSSGNA